jgi:beta propeller repeat protein
MSIFLLLCLVMIILPVSGTDIIPISIGPGVSDMDISGDTVVWLVRNADSDIYKWDPVNGEQRVTTTSAGRLAPTISGDTIVWMEGSPYTWDIYKWDPVNGKQPVSTALLSQSAPAISDDNIVWDDIRNDVQNSDIYKWDPVNGEQPVCTASGDQILPAISGDTIVWMDYRNGDPDIYKWDPVNGEQPVCTASGDQQDPKISGDTIVWADFREGSGTGDIYKWDPINGEQRVTNDPKTQWWPDISGDTIVWDDERNGNSDIYKWDPVNGEQPVYTGPYNQRNPKISGNNIVWSNFLPVNGGIYGIIEVGNQPPVAAFEATPLSGPAPLKVIFTDKSTGDGITSRVWEYKPNSAGIWATLPLDGMSSFTFTDTGTYDVQLTVTGTGGSKTKTMNDYITVLPVSFNITPSKIRITDNIQFDASQSAVATQDTIFWEFGDGTTDSSGIPVIIHSYSKPGSYTVKLTVTNSAGIASSSSQIVNVTIPVVLVHGWRSDATNWNSMTDRLQQEGFETWNFDYKTLNTADPKTVAPLLSTFIDTQRSDLSYNGQQYNGKVDIVCHSMGALVSRLYMENLDGGIHGKDVRQWIGIAPAHHGSALADYSTDNPFVAAIGYLFGGDALFELQTDSSSVQALGPLSPTTKYRVIAGWNPTYSSNFGGGFLPATLAKRTSGSGPLYYWTHSGDMIVATAQSHDSAMGFDAYPIGGILGDSPAKEFDHIDICGSPRVIEAVVGYLEDIDKSSSNIVPIEDVIPHDYSLSEKVISGLLGNTLQRIIVAVAVNAINSNSQATHATLQATSSSPESALISLLEWDDGDINMTLTSPSGIEYSADSLPSDIWYTKNGNSLNYIITAPESGNWTANLDPTEYPGHDIHYNLTYYVRDISSTPIVVVLPSQSNPPTDPNHDGLYEDLNANNRKDFNDVVLMFNQMQWIAANEPVSAFDFNGNGRIDFNDIVKLFGEI